MDNFNFIHKIYSETWSQSDFTDVNTDLAEPVMLFCAEWYLWSSIGAEDSPNFLKYFQLNISI